MQIERIRAMFDTPPILGFKCTDQEGLNIWRRQLRAKMKDLIPVNQSRALLPVSVSPIDHKCLDAFAYTFKGFADLVIRAVFLKPRGNGPYPFVLVCPGRFSDYRKTAGLLPVKYPDENIAEQLAIGGMATLTLDYGFSSNIDPAVLNGRDETNLFAISAMMLGYSPLALITLDFLGALFWAETMNDIDTRKMALFGRSLGGSIVVALSLLYDKPLVVALSSFLGNFKSIFTENFMAGGVMSLMGVHTYADLPDLVAAISPNPLHLQHGENDPFYPIHETLAGVEVKKKSYALCGCSNDFDFHMTDTGHGTDVRYVFDFFNKYLMRRQCAV